MTTAEKATTDRRELVKWLALAGIVGSALFAASGGWDMISPATSANGSQILDPTHFQIGGILLALANIGWLATAFAFYLRGAMGSGWLGKIAVGIMATGFLAAIVDQITRVIAVRETQVEPWQIILFTGAIFIGPILLGVAALRARVIPFWMALYPVIMVAVVPFALWTLYSIIGIGPGLVGLLQGILWLGFAAQVYVDPITRGIKTSQSLRAT